MTNQHVVLEIHCSLAALQSLMINQHAMWGIYARNLLKLARGCSASPSTLTHLPVTCFIITW